MILKKNEETDDFTLLVERLVENEGDKRKPFVKSPLKPRGRTFFDWLRSVFRFKRDPFRASPFAAEIGLRERTEVATEDAQTRQESVHGDLDVIVDVNARLKDYSRTASTSADAVADRLDNELLDQEHVLNQCRPENLKNSLFTFFEERVGSLKLGLLPFARDRANAAQALDEFYDSNRLSRNTYAGEDLTTGSILQIGAIVVFEFVLNTIFFAGSNPLGMVGAASIAFLLSIATILLGVWAGWSFQLTHRNFSARALGYVLMVLCALASAYYLLLLTNARLAGENGELKMFTAAAVMIQTHPFAGLLDLPSLAYCLFSIAVILGVAIKFVNVMGRFPGLKRHVSAKRYTEEDFEDELSDIVAESQEKGKKCIEALDHLPAFVNGCRGAVSDIMIDYENVRDQFAEDIDALRSSERVLFGFIKGRLKGVSTANNELSAWGADESVNGFDSRLQEKQAMAQTLLNRDGVSPGEIDRCRNEILAATNQQVERLTSEAEKIFDERLDHAHREHRGLDRSRSDRPTTAEAKEHN